MQTRTVGGRGGAQTAVTGRLNAGRTHCRPRAQRAVRFRAADTTADPPSASSALKLRGGGGGPVTGPAARIHRIQSHRGPAHDLLALATHTPYQKQTEATELPWTFPHPIPTHAIYPISRVSSAASCGSTSATARPPSLKPPLSLHAGSFRKGLSLAAAMDLRAGWPWRKQARD